MPCRGHGKAAAEPRLTEERSKAEFFSALRRSDENQVLLPAGRGQRRISARWGENDSIRLPLPTQTIPY